jgi:hypothetical protein
LDTVAQPLGKIGHEGHGMLAGTLADAIGRDVTVSANQTDSGSHRLDLGGHRGAAENISRNSRENVADLMEVEVIELQRAVERMHACKATLAQSVPVTEGFEGKTVWEGVVHVFDLKDHPTAARAYAWSSPIEGGDKRRFFAVLHLPPVTSPADAVRAAIAAEHREEK